MNNSWSILGLPGFALLCVFSLNPVYIWGMFPQVQAALLIIICIIFFYRVDSLAEKNILMGGLSLVLAFFFYISLGATFLGALFFSVFLFLLFQLNREEIISIFKVFKFLFVFSLFPAVLLWIIHHVTGDFGIFSMGYIDEALVPSVNKIEAGQYYIRYPFSVILEYMLDYPYYRLFGPYDEPGVVGTISALILAADRFRLRSFSNIILIIAGIFSFSLAFFILCFAGLAISAFRTRRHFIVLLVGLALVAFIASRSDFFDNMVFERLSISSGGNVAGDNRSSDELDDAYESWKNSPVIPFFFGLSWKDTSGSSSWKLIPVQVGIFGSISFLIIFFFLVKKFSAGINYYSISFIIVFLISIYQRPGVITPAYLLIFSGGLIISRGDKIFLIK